MKKYNKWKGINLKKIDIIILGAGPNYVEVAFRGSFSVNRLYRHRKGRHAPYNQVKDLVEKKLKQYYSRYFEYKYNKYDKYKFKYIFVFRTKAINDVSNYIKFMEDMVFNYFLQDNDTKVYLIHAEKHYHKIGQYNYVRIEWEEYKEDSLFLEKFVGNSSLGQVYNLR